jgi:hypothetical protein
MPETAELNAEMDIDIGLPERIVRRMRPRRCECLAAIDRIRTIAAVFRPGPA